MSNLSAKATLGGSLFEGHGGEATVNNLTDFFIEFAKAADDGMASTATSDTKFWTNPYDFDVQLVSFKYSANGGGITADDTNYATIQIKSDDAANSAPAVALDMKTQLVASGGTGNIAEDVAASSTGRTPANTTLKPGANAWFAIAKSGSGVVVRAGRVTVRVRRIG